MKTAQLSPEELSRKMDEITAYWADKGQIIEGGWQVMLSVSLHSAPESQIKEMRKAYFLGAQHLFASIISFLDEDREVTDRDMQRMGLIHDELERFRQSLMH
jgi:hypothetical protein